jgi:hypothetical protein
MLVVATIYAHWVRYPELRNTPPADFAQAHERHTLQYGLLIGLPFVALPLLVLGHLFAKLTPASAIAGVLLLIAHGVTLTVSAPCHSRLAGGFDAATMDRLMASNPPRLVAWSLLMLVSLVAGLRE